MNVMKQIFIISIAFLCLVSCDKIGADSNTLIGKWQRMRYEMETIYADGSTRTSQGTFEVAEYWDFNKEGSVKCTDQKGKITEYSYSFDKENMVLTIGSDRINIKELTRNSLVTVSSGNFIDGSVQPAGVGTTISYVYWSKIK